MSKERTMTKYRLVSLFSGCGGADLGFLGDFEFLGNKYAPLPFEIVWANDINEYACKVYQANFGNHIELGDISKINFQKVAPAYQNADILLAGFPCQEFSFMGLRRGLTSVRGRLYKEMRRAIRHFKPKMFLAENVPGIQHPPNVLRGIINGLKGRKSPLYEIKYYQVDAADYGVPQVRKRVFIVGIRTDLPKTFIPPPATHCSPGGLNDHRKAWVTTKDALDSLWDPGGIIGDTNDQEKLTHATIHFRKGHPRDGQANPNTPCTTIRAEHHGHVQVHYNTLSNGSLRRLTIRECARIQGFPDLFTFPVSATQAYRQIGNAIPPILAYNWAVSIRDWLDNLENGYTY